jgi:hypothetical protein
MQGLYLDFSAAVFPAHLLPTPSVHRNVHPHRYTVELSSITCNWFENMAQLGSNRLQCQSTGSSLVLIAIARLQLGTPHKGTKRDTQHELMKLPSETPPPEVLRAKIAISQHTDELEETDTLVPAPKSK